MLQTILTILSVWLGVGFIVGLGVGRLLRYNSQFYPEWTRDQ